MGLFDFFKKKQKKQETDENELFEVLKRDNFYVIDQILSRLENQGYKVVKDDQYCSVMVNERFLISTAILNEPGLHNYVFNLVITIVHEDYFPNGILENIASIGATFESKVDMAIDILFKTLLNSVLNIEKVNHSGDGIEVTTNKRKVIVHSIFGDYYLNGNWSQVPQSNYIYDTLKSIIDHKIKDQKFNLLKIYASKSVYGDIHSECLLNGLPVPEAIPVLERMAHSWDLEADFKAIRQFVFFVRDVAFETIENAGENQIIRAITSFIEHYDDKNKIYTNLLSIFETEIIANQYFNLIPIIFCRTTLGGRLTNEIITHDIEAGQTVIEISEHPIAISIFETIFNHFRNLDKESILKVLLQSKEFVHIHTLELQGKQFSEMKFYPIEMDVTKKEEGMYRFED